MVIKKKQITVTEYVCSNCGAVHKSKTKFYKCRITGEEICDNCMEEAHLIEIGTPNNIGDNSDYEVYMMNYPVPVKSDLVKLSDSNISSNLNTSATGSYDVTYSYDNADSIKRIVEIIN